MRPLALGVVRRIAQECLEARVPEPVLDDARQLRVKRVCDVEYDEPDALRPPSAQRARLLIDPVPEFVDCR